MLRVTTSLLAPVLLTACGGGGGGGSAPPPAGPGASLAAPAVRIASGSTRADLTVRLTSGATPAPVLLQAQVELPPQLRFADADRLRAATPFQTLEGNLVDDATFAILCGDSANVGAATLPLDDLFRVGLEVKQPRQPGTYTVLLRDVRMASADATRVPTTASQLQVPVTIE